MAASFRLRDTPHVNDSIVVKGARLHNLKNVTVVIPKNKLVVLTGLSGSGKSTLALDTLHREGQRQRVAYAIVAPARS
jgi:excinuclease UvrABC ATPase subunit